MTKPQMPLTPLQRAALDAVRGGRVAHTARQFGWRVIHIFTADGRDVSSQLRALHRRKLIKRAPAPKWYEIAEEDVV